MRTIFLALYNETSRRLILTWSYRFNLIVEVLEVLLLYVGISLFVGNGKLSSGQLAGTLIGYIIWFYARVMIMSTGSELIGEAHAGTLEQMYMSPLPPVVLLLGRMIAILVTTTILLIPPFLILVAVFHIQYTFHWESIPVLLLTLGGLLGFSLAISGAALVFKQIDSLADLTQNLMLFLTGALLPVTLFPGWLANFAKTLPITQGIIVLRALILDDKSLGNVWADGSLFWLLVNAVAYTCVGAFIFVLCERSARNSGSLGHY
ncbi:MAG TPA: ABC transporter permease [Ktedonobacteraceae bacterium]|nr:ABC transporter permease [Ktedonobacteraceae bacterium]